MFQKSDATVTIHRPSLTLYNSINPIGTTAFQFVVGYFMNEGKSISLHRHRNCFVVMTSLKWTRYDSCAYVLESGAKTSTLAHLIKVKHLLACLLLQFQPVAITFHLSVCPRLFVLLLVSIFDRTPASLSFFCHKKFYLMFVCFLHWIVGAIVFVPAKLRQEIECKIIEINGRHV